MRSGESNVVLGFLAWLLTAALAIYVWEVSVTVEGYLSSNPFARLQPTVLLTLLATWLAGGAYFLHQVFRQEKAQGELSKPLRTTLVVGILLTMTAFAWVKPVTARDPCYYVAYGRQVVTLKVNPYKTLLQDCATDPVISQVAPMWFNTPCLYGPLSVGVFSLGNLLSPKEEIMAICSSIRLLYVPMLALLGLMLCRAWGWSRWPVTLTLAVICNPIFLHLALNSAHPEAWLLFWLLATCLAMTSERPVVAALCFSAACSTKIVPIVLIPVYLCWWFRKGMSNAAKFLLTYAAVHGSLYMALGGADYPGVLRSPDGWNPLSVTGGPVIRTFLAFSFSETASSRLALVGFFIFGGAFCLWLLKTRSLPNAYAVTSVTLALLYFFRTTCTAWYTLWFWPFLWLAYRKERHAAIALFTWTASVYVARELGWTLMIWTFTFTYSYNLWLLWKERKPA